MKQSTLKKNYIYNLTYQILILVLPLITAPYLSRIVGVKGVGIYSYTYSIVYYFMLMTLLGVNNYGNRTIAKVREDKKELSKSFWGIYCLQLFMGSIMLILYYFYIILFNNEYKLIGLIQGIYIVSAILDINWFFLGTEEFKKTIKRNIFIKFGTVILIFTLVKSKNDLWIYTLIMAGMTCLSQLILWFFLRKRISFEKINLNEIKHHLKKNIILFIPVIAVSLYKIMDKIMLGVIANISEVGFYENAEKIINIPLTTITALGTIMLPRASNLVAKGDNEKIKKYMSKSISLVMFLSFAMCCGLIGIGYNFAPLYFGKEFQKTGILIMMLAITLPFLSFANVLRTQYLIPNERDKTYIISVSLGAITNMIMNLIFIPKLGSIGACFGTIIAEGSVMLHQTISVWKELEVKKWIKDILPFLLKSIIMFLIIYPMNYININSILRLSLQVILGILIYLTLNIKYILNIIDINKFKRRKER